MRILSKDGLSSYCEKCQCWRNFFPVYGEPSQSTAVSHRFYGCDHEMPSGVETLWVTRGVEWVRENIV